MALAGSDWRWTDDRGVQRIVPTDELRAALRDHVLPPSTLVWRDGMETWVAASEVPELASAVGPPPAAAKPGGRGMMKTLVGMQAVSAEDQPKAPPVPIVVPSPRRPDEPAGKKGGVTKVPSFDDAARSPSIPKAPRLPAVPARKVSDVPPASSEVDALWKNASDGEDVTLVSDGPSEPFRSKDGQGQGAAAGLRPRPSKPPPRRPGSIPPEATPPPPATAASPLAAKADAPGSPPALARAAASLAGAAAKPPGASGASASGASASVSSRGLGEAGGPAATGEGAVAGDGRRVGMQTKRMHPPPMPSRIPTQVPPPPKLEPSPAAKAPPAKPPPRKQPVAAPPAAPGKGLDPQVARPQKPVLSIVAEIDAEVTETKPRAPAPKLAPITETLTLPEAPRVADEKTAELEPSMLAPARPADVPEPTPLGRDATTVPLPVAESAREAAGASPAERGGAALTPTAPDPALEVAEAGHLIAAPEGGAPTVGAPTVGAPTVGAPTIDVAGAPASRAADQPGGEARAKPPRKARGDTGDEGSVALESSSEPPAPAPLKTPPPALAARNVRVTEAEAEGAEARGQGAPDAVLVPFRSVVAASLTLVTLAVVAFFVGRSSALTSPDELHRRFALLKRVTTPAGGPSPVAAAAPLRPCWVARQPQPWAPEVTRSVPFEVSSAEGAFYVGYAKSKRDAQGVVIDPKSGKVLERFNEAREEDVALVVPSPRDAQKFSVVSVLKEGSKVKSLTAVPGAPTFFLGQVDATLARLDTPDGAPDKLFDLEAQDDDKGVDALRVRPAAERGTPFVLRRAGVAYAGWLGPDRKPVGALSKVVGSGGGVGKPTLSWNGREVAVVFADRPKDKEHWEIRLAHAPFGEAPSATTVIPLPAGGPGGDAFAPDIMGLPDGRWVLVWTEGPEGSRAVRAQTLDDKLAPLGDPIAVSTPGGNFGQGVLAVAGTYVATVFLSKGETAYELWGAVLQCG
jgi:hypothetical protein